jgi:hypothetical protein
LRVLGGVDFRGSVDFELFYSSELFLSLLCHFAWLYRFSRLLLALVVFLLLNHHLELFSLFGSSSCASWGLRFELQTLCFCCQMTHQGGD